MSFEWPLALVGLVAVPLLIAAYVLRERRRTEFAARFTTPALLPNLVDAAPSWRRHVPLALLLVGLTAMLVGVARPHATVSVKREQATVILDIDTSISMGADDVKPTRLEAARGLARAFLDQIPAKYRVAIVGFSGRAYVALPPTDDRTLARAALRSLHTAEGTSLGDALALSTQLARRQRAEDGTLPPAAIVVICAPLAVLAVGVGSAAATNECRGLQVCVRVAGPWVVVPASRAPAQFQLACPRGFIVGGLDAELSDRAIDLDFGGLLGSPVNPGVTTSRSVVFRGAYTGATRRTTTFRPHIGCIPAAGGGSGPVPYRRGAAGSPPQPAPSPRGWG